MRAIALVFLCSLITACSWGDGSGSDDDDPNNPPPPVCGDGTCATAEIGNCSADCGNQQAPVCGNNKCESGENNNNCITDCPTNSSCNNNGTCDPGESNANCALDCPLSGSCPANVGECVFCAITGIGCPAGLDMAACGACLMNGGGSGCVGGIPNMMCDPGETMMNCPFDCM